MRFAYAPVAALRPGGKGLEPACCTLGQRRTPIARKSDMPIQSGVRSLSQMERSDVTDGSGDEVRRLARELLPRAMSVSARITERVLQAVPEMAPAGAANAVHLVQE